MTIREHAEAMIEITGAAVYLEYQRPGYGDRFLDAYDAALGRIQSMPAMYAAVEGTMCRECVILKFSYSIIYLPREHEIVVVAMADAKRRPNYWIDRLDDLEDES